MKPKMSKTTKIPLRVILLAESCAAGVGRHVADLAETLHLSGQAVHLLYSTNHMDDRFRSQLAYLSSLGVQVHPMSINHAPHPADMWTIHQIRRYISANGPFDILHCHSTKAGLIGRLATLKSKCLS